MGVLDGAKWIWAREGAECDEYAEFVECVDYAGGETALYISADSNYTVHINGYLAAFGQYADFPHDKVYDKIDVSEFMRLGRNVIAIRVWYYGIDTTQTYYPGEAGVIYALEAGGVVLISSSERSLSRLSPTYEQHRGVIITGQLGLSFSYDSTRADGWMLGDEETLRGFTASYETGAVLPLRERSCRRCEFGETMQGKDVTSQPGVTPIGKGGKIFDLGEEGVGFICLDFAARGEQGVTVAFGEHIADGHVRMEVGGRRFAFDYRAQDGRNYYMNSLRRFGCRYVELIPEGEIADINISLRRVVYPVQIKEPEVKLTPVQRKIYDSCVYTLQCCMHEHYEDCPWREQALYTMDSRNQMLSGYYAFGEYVFPRANLELIAQDNRSDGLLSICYPMRSKLAIPSFSLHFIIECFEYLEYSKDTEFIRKIYPKMKSVLETFVDKIGAEGLIPPIAGAGMWNFYEWTDDLSGNDYFGKGYTEEGLEPDLILNSLLAIAIEKFGKIQDALGLSHSFDGEGEVLREKIHSHFYDANRGVYLNRVAKPSASKLGNALAILANAADAKTQRIVAEKLVGEGITEASLSMQGFVYDALVKVDKARYGSFILDNIERVYLPMLEIGNRTVWETEFGESDFGNAGSLCHGWSAIPIYYYNLLLEKENGKS